MSNARTRKNSPGFVLLTLLLTLLTASISSRAQYTVSLQAARQPHPDRRVRAALPEYYPTAIRPYPYEVASGEQIFFYVFINKKNQTGHPLQIDLEYAPLLLFDLTPDLSQTFVSPGSDRALAWISKGKALANNAFHVGTLVLYATREHITTTGVIQVDSDRDVAFNFPLSDLFRAQPPGDRVANKIGHDPHFARPQGVLPFPGPLGTGQHIPVSLVRMDGDAIAKDGIINPGKTYTIKLYLSHAENGDIFRWSLNIQTPNLKPFTLKNHDNGNCTIRQDGTLTYNYVAGDKQTALFDITVADDSIEGIQSIQMFKPSTQPVVRPADTTITLSVEKP